VRGVGSLIDNLGFRRTLHRVLSGVPALVLSVGGLMATAFPEEAKKCFWAANDNLAQPLWRNVALFALLAYFCVWWWSSIPSDTTRTKTQKGLRAFHYSLCEIQIALVGAESVAAFDEKLLELEATYTSLSEWIESNMDKSAIFKIYDPVRAKGSFPFNVQGVTDPTFFHRRNEILITNSARITALEGLIQTDGWDK
jgi:hypothetical protein